MPRTAIMPNCTDGHSHEWVATNSFEGGLTKADTPDQYEIWTHCKNCGTSRIEIQENGSVVRCEYR